MTIIKNYGMTASMLVHSANDIAHAGGRDQVTSGDLLIAFVRFPECEAASYLRSYGVDRTRTGEIEAQVILAGKLPRQNDSEISRELTLAYLTASLIPARFGEIYTSDMHLLAALLFEMDLEGESIFAVTRPKRDHLKRLALDAFDAMDINIETFRSKLLLKLVPVPIQPMIASKS